MWGAMKAERLSRDHRLNQPQLTKKNSIAFELLLWSSLLAVSLFVCQTKSNENRRSLWLDATSLVLPHLTRMNTPLPSCKRICRGSAVSRRSARPVASSDEPGSSCHSNLWMVLSSGGGDLTQRPWLRASYYQYGRPKAWCLWANTGKACPQHWHPRVRHL